MNNTSSFAKKEHLPKTWATAFNELSQRIRCYFTQSEPHKQALAYMQGLMSSAERKNGWQVAEEVGEATPYAMQHLLDRAKWDCNEVRDELRTYVREMLADPKGVLVIDETGPWAECSNELTELQKIGPKVVHSGR